MGKRFILFVFILLNLGTKGQERKNIKIADHYQTAKFDVAIFPETALDMIPGKRFTPTRKEIEKAETALEGQLKQLNSPLINQHKSPVIHKNLKKYRRQYFGYINENGHKVLFINSFWSKKEYEYWLASKVAVLDGGSYYWSINFDLDTNRFFELYINGSA